MQTLIIIATYNERDNIVELITQIFQILPHVHILVIDDSSPDKTYECVIQLQKQYEKSLFLIQRPGKLGLGSAYVTGFNWALNRSYTVIMHMDADFSHNPKYLPNFLNAIENYDLVIGSRYIKGGGVVNWGFWRKVISRGGGLYSRIILGLSIKDLTGGFKCFRRKVLETIDVNSLKANGYAFQVETTYKTYLYKFKIKEIPIIFEDRRVGQSKMSFKIFLEALFMVIKLRFTTKIKM